MSQAELCIDCLTSHFEGDRILSLIGVPWEPKRGLKEPIQLDVPALLPPPAPPQVSARVRVSDPDKDDAVSVSRKSSSSDSSSSAKVQQSGKTTPISERPEAQSGGQRLPDGHPGSSSDGPQVVNISTPRGEKKV